MWWLFPLYLTGVRDQVPLVLGDHFRKGRLIHGFSPLEPVCNAQAGKETMISQTTFSKEGTVLLRSVAISIFELLFSIRHCVKCH